jgi:hypothetical protein
VRRAVVYAAAIALLLSGGATAATEASDKARQQEIRERTCRYQWLDPGTWTAREERRTAACVVEKFGVIGGLETLWRVGDCESSWFRFAYNPNGHAGIFQHDIDAWSARVRSAMPEGWKVGPWWRWQNPRAQVVTTVRMVNWNGGWSAWSCA